MGMMLLMGISLLGSSPSDLVCFDDAVAGRSLRVNTFQKADLDTAFKMLDGDKDGKITSKDLNTFSDKMSLKLNPKMSKYLISLGDKKGNGELTLDDFGNMYHVIDKWDVLLQKEAQHADHWQKTLFTVFEAMDKNQDGKLQKSELSNLFKLMGVAMEDARVHRIVELFDQSGDGSIEWSDFSAMCSVIAQWHEVMTEITLELEGWEGSAAFDVDKERIETLQAVYDFIDTDGKGLTEKELADAFEYLDIQVEPTKVSKIVAAFDTNGDKKIAFHEFKEIFDVITTWYKFMADLVKDFKIIVSDDDLHTRFDAVDQNHDGLIDKDDLRKMFDNLDVWIDETFLDRIVMLSDGDNDGKIEWSEFLKIYTLVEKYIQ